MQIRMPNGINKNIQAVWFEKSNLPTIYFVDQRALPFEIKILESRSVQETANYIRTMVIRGAPSIGAAGAYGILQSAFTHNSIDKILEDAKLLLDSRPTAVDLKNYIQIMLDKAEESNGDISVLIKTASSLVQNIIDECNKLKLIGQELVNDDMKILTHCHTGAFAAVDIGTALSIPIYAHQLNKNIEVYVDETRPRLQGGRLTAWELAQEGVKHHLIADNVAASLMKQQKIDLILVGADRIALNGDFANKIGTYSLAVLANYHSIPFYTVAPWSTFDRELQTGEDIPIEERSANEVWHALSKDLKFHQITNKSSPVYNPGFDITPNNLLSGIVAPDGIIRKPFHENIMKYLPK